VSYLENQKNASRDEWRRRPGAMFWPPRVVSAARNDSLTLFFGSGISLGAGIPDWMGLLRQVGLDADVERDPSASGDLLTLAELAAHIVGADPLQATIREAIKREKRPPTTAHYLLAALHLPLLITTNYDCLFEDAFKIVHEKDASRLAVITQDLDVKSLLGDDIASWDKTIKDHGQGCFLIKLHGSVGRAGEHLILTRSDYRRHYRSNPLMLNLVRHLLESRHTLFSGFSHRDPEVARIIEDVIFGAENKNPPVMIPGFYSLQFDMLQKTPEIFAARGIVALQPPLVLPTASASDIRACSLAQGLTDLFDNSEQKMDEVLSLDRDLQQVSRSIETELQDALNRFDAVAETAKIILTKHDDAAAKTLTSDLVVYLDEFANQGVYLADRHGVILSSSCPAGLDSAARQAVLMTVEERPYFRLAQSNRKAFVSDVFESSFNGNATLAACLPLLDGGMIFCGLLFSAFQLNDAGFAARIRSLQIPLGASLLVTDANGVLVIPPAKELASYAGVLKISGESPVANVGYSYWELIQASRRDKRIDRLMQNVVPLSQDDVYSLSHDAVAYSVVTELEHARWKVALTRFLRIRSLKN
jgi:hypothetical protein